jgi:ankyrin repeat protein
VRQCIPSHVPPFCKTPLTQGVSPFFPSFNTNPVSSIPPRNPAAVSALLKAGANPEHYARSSSNKQQFRPIHLAARLGDMSVIRALLTGKCNLDSRDDSGKTAAMVAAEYGHEAVLDALITAGADLGLVDGLGRSVMAISDAAGHGLGVRKLILRRLVNGRPRSSDERVFHPLLFAAAEGDVYVIRRLLKLDAGDVTVPVEKLAGRASAEKEKASENKADVTARDSWDSPTSTLRRPESPSPHSEPPPPPAQTSLTPQDCPPVEIDAQDSDGNTAIILCAQQAHLGALEVLLRAGALVGLKNTNGATVLSTAEQNGLLEDVADIILEAIRDGALKASPGFHPLHFASSWKDEKAMAALLERKVEVDELNQEGLTPVMICAQRGFVEGCRLLLEAGAQAEKRGSRGLTALQLAREQGPKVSAAVKRALFDHLARKLVLTGAPLMKHTREGRGKPHEKVGVVSQRCFVRERV